MIPPSEFTFRFYTPRTYLETTGTFRKQGETTKQEHLSIRIFARFRESGCEFFLNILKLSDLMLSKLKENNASQMTKT